MSIVDDMLRKQLKALQLQGAMSASGRPGQDLPPSQNKGSATNVQAWSRSLAAIIGARVDSPIVKGPSVPSGLVLSDIISDLI